MIKVTHRISDVIDADPNTTQATVAFAFEGSREEDLPILDLLLEMLSGGYALSSGFMSTNRLIVQAKKTTIAGSCTKLLPEVPVAADTPRIS